MLTAAEERREFHRYSGRVLYRRHSRRLLKINSTCVMQRMITANTASLGYIKSFFTKSITKTPIKSAIGAISLKHRVHLLPICQDSLRYSSIYHGSRCRFESHDRRNLSAKQKNPRSLKRKSRLTSTALLPDNKLPNQCIFAPVW